MRGRTILLLLWGLGSAGLLSGCGPATVSGDVTVDGQPLAKGVISYVPADGNGDAVTAEVNNGKYQLQTAPGNKRVQISAPVVVGKRPEHNGPNAPLMDIIEESLPERYHNKTELTFEVKAGRNTRDWSVESNTRKP